MAQMDVKCYRKAYKSPKTGRGDKWVEDTKIGTLNCFENTSVRTAEIICYSIENHPNDSRVRIDKNGTVQTLSSRMGTEGNNVPLTMVSSEKKTIVRRLTPMECGRLQGFPDWWTDGVQGSESAQYTMWGNGITLPVVADVIGRLAKELEAEECE